MSYSFQLSEIPEKVSPKPFSRYAKVILDQNVIPETPMSLGFFRFAPGQTGPKHLHENEVEIYITIKGHGEVTVGDETFAMHPGTIVYVQPQVEHQTKNTGNVDMEFYGVFSPSVDLSGMNKWEDASSEKQS
jgi:mannose-6-phosphate isomerase-like protein (cupin superfamily)